MLRLIDYTDLFGLSSLMSLLSPRNKKIQSEDISTPYIEEGKLMNNSEFAIYTHDFGLGNPMSLPSSIKQKMFVLYLGIDEYTSSKAKNIEALIFCRRLSWIRLKAIDRFIIYQNKIIYQGKK